MLGHDVFLKEDENTPWSSTTLTLYLTTVFYVKGITSWEVKKDLINHDGYPENIWVQRSKG